MELLTIVNRHASEMQAFSVRSLPHRVGNSANLLFVHTGGLPAIFAYADRLGSWLSEAPWAPAG